MKLSTKLALRFCQGTLLLGFLFVIIQCSIAPSSPTARDISDAIQSGSEIKSFCKGDECCSEHRNCIRNCNKIFYASDKQITEKCKSLPRETVHNLYELTVALKRPVLNVLRRIDLSEFRLLLALDWQAWVRIIKTDYTIDTAKEVLIWLAENKEPIQELKSLPKEVINEILYELLASAGGAQSNIGPVEQALAQKTSFDKSFFELIIYNSNYEFLQMTHDMIRADLCGVHWEGENQIDLCITQIYCKQKYQPATGYVHSEDLRNKMARNIQDENFFNYIHTELLYTTSHSYVLEPTLSNQVCRSACLSQSRSCE